jgi:uncharacterized protein
MTSITGAVPALTGTLLLLMLAAIRPGPAEASDAVPSFDCSHATGADEHAICADALLAEIDVLVSKAYAIFTPTFGDKRQIGKELLDSRRACGGDQACIAGVEVNALETYGDYVPWAESYVDALIGERAARFAASHPGNLEQPVPQGIAECAATHIVRLTTRFGDPLATADAGEGSAVEFRNGGRQVAYDVADALRDAEPLDKVVMCLASIPRDCPAGDVRGRVYYVLDTRTNETWEMPDSQHSCGGA